MFLASVFALAIQPDPAVIQMITSDRRVIRSVQVVVTEFGHDCTVAADAWTVACNGGGDFQSCFYTAPAVCSPMGAPGPQTVRITAEYNQLANRILDVTVASEFKQ